MNKSCFIAPVHPPKFSWAKQLIISYNKYYNNNNIFLIFSTKDESILFKQLYPDLQYQSIEMQNTTAIHPFGIPTEKKIFGLQWIFNHTDYEYVASIDADCEFFRNVDYDILFQNFFTNAIVYGHYIDKPKCSHSPRQININCARFFPPEYQLLLKEYTQDFNVYFWFNDIPIYEKSTFKIYLQYTELLKYVPTFTFFDFDYIIYVYFLLLLNNYNINSSLINENLFTLKILDYRFSMCGSFLEMQRRIPENTFLKDYIIMNPMWINKKIEDIHMKNTFMILHADRSRP